jgi:hypothetical protein
MNAAARLVRILAVIAVLFGVLTVLSGGMALFGPEQARARLGDVVPLVLWFNFLAGFAYVGAGVGLYLGRPGAVHLAAALAAATVLVFGALGWHAATGGAYEVRTVAAMSLRSIFWVVVWIVAVRALARREPSSGG